jgi:hypothetical protein
MVTLYDGSHLERYDEAGSLIPPDVETMAREAFVSRGKLYVPQPVWVKDFPSQVSEGRIGRRAVRYAPVDELPSKVADQVKSALPPPPTV